MARPHNSIVGRPSVNGQIRVPQTQAFGLSRIEETLLYTEVILLKHPAMIDLWCNDVARILGYWNLELLIDPSIPRPAEESPDFLKWWVASKSVRDWLAGNTPTALLRTIEHIHGPTDYADELMHSIKLTCFELRQFLPAQPPLPLGDTMRALARVIKCKRADWPNALVFIKELIRSFWFTMDLDLSVPATLPLTILFDELREEFPGIIQAKSDEVEDILSGGRYLSNNEFITVCSNVLDRIVAGESDDLENMSPGRLTSEQSYVKMMGSASMDLESVNSRHMGSASMDLESVNSRHVGSASMDLESVDSGQMSSASMDLESVESVDNTCSDM